MDRPLRIYLWLAFGITWGFGGLGLLAGAYRPDGASSSSRVLHYIAAFGPSLAGFIMVARVDGRAGMRRMLVRTIPTRSALPWYLVVIIGFPALNLLATWLIAPASIASVPSWDRVLFLLPLTLVTDTGPLGEEFGWRGFALPRMLARGRPLTAALILGAIWWAWHLPTFFIPTLSQSHLSIPVFLINSVALSVIMTWLYLRTGGDLLLMILVHVVANYVAEIGVPFNAEVIAEVACAALIVACGGLRSGSPHGQSSEGADVDRPANEVQRADGTVA
jgi:membrane protease YdiL (CAAX protease family)